MGVVIMQDAVYTQGILGNGVCGVFFLMIVNSLNTGALFRQLLTVTNCLKIAGADSPIFKIVGAKAPIASKLNTPLSWLLLRGVGKYF